MSEIENFYGVYLLYSTNPRYQGWTYIGFTVNPNRRIKQHNGGRQAGGARRTHGRGPWDMVLIVHGFPNMISALRFEWAWTKPQLSRRLRHLPRKRNNEKKFVHCLRVMCEMLRMGPWNRLPLTVRWLKQEYQIPFDPTRLPPAHMPVEYGPVKAIKVKGSSVGGEKIKTKNLVEGAEFKSTIAACVSCFECQAQSNPDANILACFSCSTSFHTLCLARRFLATGEGGVGVPPCLLPVGGECPSCGASVLWGDLVRYKHGCYQTANNTEADHDFQHWADELQF